MILGVATAVAVFRARCWWAIRCAQACAIWCCAAGQNGRRSSPARSFSASSLANEVAGSAPLIVLQGVVTHEKDRRRASNVAVYGVDDRFWKFHGVASHDGPTSIERGAGSRVGRASGDAILLRVEKPSAIPIESLQGRKDDPGRTIRFDAGRVLEATQLGDFRCGRRRAMCSRCSFRCGDCSAILRNPVA